MSQFDLKKDEALVKQAAVKEPSNLVKVLGPLAMATGVAGMAGLYGYFKGTGDQKQHKEELAKSLSAAFAKDKSFAQKPQQFAQLFGELSVLSPSVAKNPTLASKLIKERMKSGFGLDDVHKLSVIESSGGAARHFPTPGAAAMGAASGALGTTLTNFGPHMLPKFMEGLYGLHGEAGARIEKRKKADKLKAQSTELFKQRTPEEINEAIQGTDYADELEARATKRKMEKKSSAEPEMVVSDECLGVLLSDRFTLLKQANAATGAKPSFFAMGAKAMGEHLAYIAPALAIGGGLGLVKLVYDKMGDNQLKQEADNNFAKLMRVSDIAKGNPEVARESFETLKMVAPILATRPGVLRSFIENQAQTGMLPNYEQVKALAESGQAVDRSRAGNKTFFTGVKDILDFGHLPVVMKKHQSGKA